MTVLPPSVAHVGPVAPRKRGKGLVIAGSVLLAVSVVGGIIGFAVTLGRLNLADFDRDVVIDGQEVVAIPGRIAFTVAEPLDDSTDPDMSVGVATTTGTFPTPTCTLVTVGGESIQLTTAMFDTTLYRDSTDQYEVIGFARLTPGEYEARCTVAGEPSQSGPASSFTVGRTFGTEEFDDAVGPVLGFFGVLGVSGLLFVIGTILLIVGLVQRSRSGRPPTTPYGGMPAPWGPPQQPWGQPYPHPAPGLAAAGTTRAAARSGVGRGPDPRRSRPRDPRRRLLRPGRTRGGRRRRDRADPVGPGAQSAKGSLPNFRLAVSMGSNGKLSWG